MEQTTVVISCLGVDDFVAAPGRQLSLADQIKLALLNLSSEESDRELFQDIINWSNLPFLYRIVVIFNNGVSALKAYRYLKQLYHQEKPFILPSTAKISLQENLLRRSKLADTLSEDSALHLMNSLSKFKTSHGPVDTYQEPEPQRLNTYDDLMKLGDDVTRMNSNDLINMLEPNKSKSATKTLFRSKLQLSTSGTGGSVPLASPTITLDELPN